MCLVGGNVGRHAGRTLKRRSPMVQRSVFVFERCDTTDFASHGTLDRVKLVERRLFCLDWLASRASHCFAR